MQRLRLLSYYGADHFNGSGSWGQVKIILASALGFDQDSRKDFRPDPLLLQNPSNKQDKGFSQLPFTCNQEEKYVGTKNFFSPTSESESAFRPYFQEPSSTRRPLVGDIQSCNNNLVVEGKETQDEEDCQILEPTKKRRFEHVKKKTST